MGDGIGGPVVRCISGNAFELDVTHYRKDNQEQYSRIEKIIISKIDNPEKPEYKETVEIVNGLINEIEGLRPIYLGPGTLAYLVEMSTPLLLNAMIRNKMKNPGIIII